jgi:UDP-N-acetylglucosamine 4-epimerase
MYDQIFHSEDLSKFKFLVTGGAGFIGSNIVEYLIKYGAGYVRVLDNLSTGNIENLQPFMQLNNFEFQKGDIRNLEDCISALDGVDYVFHEAALGSVPRSISDPITSNEVNINGFLNILVAAKNSISVKRIVYAASSSTYGDHSELPKLEHRIGRPLSPYAVTKYVNELYADVFAKTYGIQTIGLRYFNVFGQRQDPNGTYAAVIPLFIKAILNESPVNINGDGEQSRDFTYIENVVQANIKAMLVRDQSALNQIYNVAYGERTTLNELISLLEGLTTKVLNKIYRDSRLGDVKHSLASIDKARELLGYEPRFNFKDGLINTYNYYKEKI